MIRAAARAVWLLLSATSLACSGGESAPRNDTPTPDGSPALPPAARAPATAAWNTEAGLFFVLHTAGDQARVVNPAFTDEQSLDTLAIQEWPLQDTPLDLIGNGVTVGRGTLTTLQIDSACSGWPVARLSSGVPAAENWRVGFAANRVDPLPFDSLSVLSGADSIALTTAAARAASRLPDDTATAFRGRPFVVRQGNRIVTEQGTMALVEIIRQVSQEANPLHEQILLLLADSGGSGVMTAVLGVRRIGLEEQLASIELLVAVRLRSSGEPALLVRRDFDGGFLLQWIERGERGWRIRWQSALDGC